VKRDWSPNGDEGTNVTPSYDLSQEAARMHLPHCTRPVSDGSPGCTANDRSASRVRHGQDAVLYLPQLTALGIKSGVFFWPVDRVRKLK
jgi:hypothetical protein